MANKKKTIKEKKFTTKMRKKLLVVFFIVGALLIFLSVMIIRLNLNKGEAYSKAVYDNFTYTSKTIAAKRGDITDRNGTILAYSVKVYNLILDAKVMMSEEKYIEPTVEEVKKCFPTMDVAAFDEYIKENSAKASSERNTYRRILLGLGADEVSEFQEVLKTNKNVKGVWLEEEYKRVYPYDSLGADVLGFASESNGGELGIENQYNSELSGIDGRTYGYIDNNSFVSDTINATNGNTIVSTIDYTVQNIIEECVREFNEENGSLTTTVLVMDPNNGEVLGLADYPTFDLNNPRDLTSMYTQEEIADMTDEEVLQAYMKLWSNYTTTSIYEPGSVFKAFVIASALEEGLVKPNDIWTCDGEQVYNGATIHCHEGVGHGDITTVGALAQSCNDALMQIGSLLGPEKFNQYLRAFQFGRKTGVDLPSEEQGLLINEATMMDVDLATNSFGQNLNVNMFQMTAAFASLINGGNYYQPHVVKEIQNSSGDVVKTYDSTLVSKTISEETSDLMKQFLRATVDFGTPMIVCTPGYSIGGKTGTAQKAGRLDDSYIVSFMGFLSAENPQFLVYVVVDSPQIEEYYNSSAAQMIFNAIFKKLTLYYGINQGYPDYTLQFKIYADDADYRHCLDYDPSSALVTPVEGDDDEDKINSIDEDDRIDQSERVDNEENSGDSGNSDNSDNSDNSPQEEPPPENSEENQVEAGGEQAQANEGE